jgi:hypothetical protein
LDKKAFEEVEERLLAINKVIAKLDPSIKIVAFEFLKPFISGGTLPTPTEKKKEVADHLASADVADLVQKHGAGKPHENINLIAAIWFGEYGSNPFSLEYVRDKAKETGLTISARPDMALKQAKDAGKNLFAVAGRGLFKPTVTGEAFFKTTYNVRKGTKTPASDK